MKKAIITSEGIVYREILINACNCGSYFFEFNDCTYEDYCIYKCTEMIDILKEEEDK